MEFMLLKFSVLLPCILFNTTRYVLCIHSLHFFFFCFRSWRISDVLLVKTCSELTDASVITCTSSTLLPIVTAHRLLVAPPPPGLPVRVITPLHLNLPRSLHQSQQACRATNGRLIDCTPLENTTGPTFLTAVMTVGRLWVVLIVFFLFLSLIVQYLNLKQAEWS